MFTRTKSRKANARVALSGAVVLGTLIVSLGVAVPSSSASSSSAFCKSILTYESTGAGKAAPPTKITTTSYRAWAKSLLPFYETLASEAPNANTKTALDEVVTILKYESNEKSLTSLEAYVTTNKVKFENGTKALVKAIVSCSL